MYIIIINFFFFVDTTNNLNIIINYLLPVIINLSVNKDSQHKPIYIPTLSFYYGIAPKFECMYYIIQIYILILSRYMEKCTLNIDICCRFILNTYLPLKMICEF